MLNASCQCTKPWNSQAHAVASNTVGDFLFGLFLVETSCLGQIQHLFNLSFFMIIVAVFSFFLLFLFLQNIFCTSSNTQGLSAHSTNIWHADRTGMVTVPFKKKHPFLDFFDLFYLKLRSENILK